MSPLAAEQLDVARRVWWAAHGLPYRWGGDTFAEGFDCSGLVVEGLQAPGILPRDQDMNAAGLAQHFPLARALRPGCLLFWGHPIAHVEIVWQLLANGTVLTLGASGGGSTTTTEDAAAQQGAYVKLRPARSGWVRVVDPFASSVTP